MLRARKASIDETQEVKHELVLGMREVEVQYKIDKANPQSLPRPSKFLKRVSSSGMYASPSIMMSCSSTSKKKSNSTMAFHEKPSPEEIIFLFHLTNHE